jgi:hypothetical protein
MVNAALFVPSEKKHNPKSAKNSIEMKPKVLSLGWATGV